MCRLALCRQLFAMVLVVAALHTPVMAETADPLSALGVRASVGAAPGYLPDRVCGTCHAGLYQSYQDVGMSHSFAKATPEHLVEDFDNAEYFHEKSQRHYRMERRGDELWFRRWKQDAGGNPTDVFETRVDWIVGSGNRARSYLYQTAAGELYELPLGWYSQGRHWAMSPGYDLPHHEGVTRPVRRECLFCHNAYPEVAAGSDAHGEPQLFPKGLPEGTGCQRCHGPGADHVRAVLTGQPIETIHSKIVNPIKLPWPQRNQVCFQCHLLPAVEIIGQRRMERTDYSFRPGQELGDYLLHVDITQPELPREDRFQINHHAYRLMQSTCYIKSEGNMGCVSCHDPHVKVKGDARIPWFRDKCLACHQDFKHDAPEILASAQQKQTTIDDCTRCHMPQRRTQDVVEVSMTDHRIARGPFDEAALLAPLEREVPTITDIEFFTPSSAPTGKVGNAYLALTILRAIGAGYALDALQKALTPLSQVPTAWLSELASALLKLGRLNDAESTLAVLEKREDRDQEISQFASTVALLAQDPERALALLDKDRQVPDFAPGRDYNRAIAYRVLGKHEEAIAALRKVIEQRPVMTKAWTELARNQIALRQEGAARQSLAKALSIDPDDERTHQLMSSLAHETNQTTTAD